LNVILDNINLRKIHLERPVFKQKLRIFVILIVNLNQQINL